MVRKTKFFETEHIDNLEALVNDFLSKLPQYSIVDVKYDHIYRPKEEGYFKPMIYTAMVLYSDNKEPDNGGSTVPITRQGLVKGKGDLGF